MLKRLFWILVITSVAAMATAQDFYHRPSPLAGRTLFSLSLFEEVRTEMKTTPDTNSKIDGLLEKLQSDTQEAVSGGNGDFATIRDAIEKLNKKYDDLTLKLLSDDQAKRLKELFVQYNGAAILTDPSLSKNLELTDDQKAQVKKIEDGRWTKMQEAFGGGGGDDPAATIRKIQEEVQANLTKVLTDDQKKKLKTMEGAKFEFKKVEAGGGN